MSRISLELDDNVVALMRQDDQSLDDAARELIVMELHRRGVISGGKAAELLGMERLAFIQRCRPGDSILPSNGRRVGGGSCADPRPSFVSRDQIVANSSPLIGLQQIGQLELLAHLYGRVLVPPAVIRETTPSVPRLSWLNERRMTRPLIPRVAAAAVGDGEREAIGLALELHAQWVILDDDRARRCRSFALTSKT